MEIELIGLNELISQFPGHVYWLNNENIYQGCNSAQAKYFGLSSTLEVIGKTNDDLLNPEIAEICNKNNLEVVHSGIDKVFEEPIIWQDGSSGIVLSHKKPLRDKNGNIIGLLGTSIDFTERKKEESQLRRKLEEIDLSLEYLLSHMPGHVYWKNRHGIYMGCNDLQAISLGYKYGHEVIGETDFDLTCDKKSAITFWENDSRIMQSGIAETVEEEALVNGKKALVLSSKTPLRNKNGEILGIIGISFDITDRKQMEKELKVAKEKAEIANEAKTEFLQNIRHDIRTPLSGIVGCADILASAVDTEKVKQFTEALKQSCHELLSFLNEILESINVATGEVPLLKKRFNLREILERLMALHQAKALEKHLNLEFVFDQTVPDILIGDPVRIYRIVLELLVNALKFTREGRVKVVVSLTKKKERDVVVNITVEDTGLGISEEKKQELFIRFNRLTPSYQGIYKGAGLGLSIVKQFVDELDGEILVENNADQGSRFIFLVPLKLPLTENF